MTLDQVRQAFPACPAGLRRAWRSDDFTVFDIEPRQPGLLARLTIRRADGGEGITWDQLQAIKDACGYAEADAIELFPARRDIVFYVHARHLFVLSEPSPFVSRRPALPGGRLS